MRQPAPARSTTRTRARSCAGSTPQYDVISVDAYRQPYIPFYLATEEFFELCRDRLAPGGVVIVNAGHPEDQDDLEKVLTATMARGLPDRAARPDRGHEHAARRQRGAALGRSAWRERVPDLPRGLRPTALDAAARARPRRSTGGDVYTDDKAPVEWLIDKSIVDYARAATRLREPGVRRGRLRATRRGAGAAGRWSARQRARASTHLAEPRDRRAVRALDLARVAPARASARRRPRAGPPARAASSVSSEWLMVPSPGARRSPAAGRGRRAKSRTR